MLWVALAAALQIWVADESEKVRPQTPPPPRTAPVRLRLTAAGGECVGAQIVVRGPAVFGQPHFEVRETEGKIEVRRTDTR